MSDDKTKKGPPDSSRISLSEDYEVRHWCIKFACSRAELEQAVKAAGPSVTAVQTYFANRPPKG